MKTPDIKNEPVIKIVKKPVKKPRKKRAVIDMNNFSESSDEEPEIIYIKKKSKNRWKRIFKYIDTVLHVLVVLLTTKSI